LVLLGYSREEMMSLHVQELLTSADNR
jgi:hypothetical protein